jgi:outer membrane protein
MKHSGQIARFFQAAGIVALLLAVGARAGTVDEALQRGDASAARAALEAEIANQRDANLHRAHLEGLIAMQQGDLAKAETIFQSILTASPGFEPSRLQLVIVLEKLGRSREAAIEAERVAATTKDARLRKALQERGAVERTAPRAGVDLRFALLPSTNLTGGPSAETVMIGGLPFRLDPASREAAGIGLSFGMTAWRRWDLANNWRLTLSGSADARLYEIEEKSDETEFGLRLDFGRTAKRGALSFGPKLSVLVQGDSIARRQVGMGLAGNFVTGQKSRIIFSTELLRQIFPETPYRDGNLARGMIGFRWALKSDAMLSLEIPALRETATVAHLSHSDLGLGLNLQIQSGDLGIGLGISVSQNRYDGVYPGFGVAREDIVKNLRLSLRHDAVNWKGLAPELSITRKNQDSNIPLHDSWTTDIGISLVKRF